MNMEFIGKLPIPQEIKKEYPVTKKCAEIKAKKDAEIKTVFEGKSNKMLLVIGPCSADREESVLEYISRLCDIQSEVSEKLLIIPRVYTNKPRTTGDGYKGMLHYPDPEEKPDLLKGVISTRKLHIKVLDNFGFVTADEMLYPDNHRYLNDLLGYVAVGARSVENQEHRLTASGLNIPVGMKNPLSGNLYSMMNAIYTAHNKHTFCYRGWEVKSNGNPLTHAILRGSSDNKGISAPNYSYDDLMRLSDLYAEYKLMYPSVIIDANHSNSGKDPFIQPDIVMNVLASAKKSPEIKKMLKGFMIESYLEDGACKIDEHIFGKSITDPCLGWQKSKELIYRIADSI